MDSCLLYLISLFGTYRNLIVFYSGLYSCVCPDQLTGDHCEFVRALSFLEDDAFTTLPPLPLLTNSSSLVDLVIEFQLQTSTALGDQLILSSWVKRTSTSRRLTMCPCCKVPGYYIVSG